MTRRNYIKKVLLPLLAILLLIWVSVPKINFINMEEVGYIWVMVTIFAANVGYFFPAKRSMLDLTMYIFGIAFLFFIIRQSFMPEIQLWNLSPEMTSQLLYGCFFLAISTVFWILRDIVGWKLKEDPKPKKPETFGH